MFKLWQEPLMLKKNVKTKLGKNMMQNAFEHMLQWVSILYVEAFFYFSVTIFHQAFLPTAFLPHSFGITVWTGHHELTEYRVKSFVQKVFSSAFENVLFLECALFGMWSFWIVPILECALFGMCSFWNVPFLECNLNEIGPFWNMI